MVGQGAPEHLKAVYTKKQRERRAKCYLKTNSKEQLYFVVIQVMTEWFVNKINILPRVKGA